MELKTAIEIFFLRVIALIGIMTERKVSETEKHMKELLGSNK